MCSNASNMNLGHHSSSSHMTSPLRANSQTKWPLCTRVRSWKQATPGISSLRRFIHTRKCSWQASPACAVNQTRCSSQASRPALPTRPRDAASRRAVRSALRNVQKNLPFSKKETARSNVGCMNKKTKPDMSPVRLFVNAKAADKTCQV